MIDKKRVLNEFFDLVKVPCSTHDERALADILKAKLPALGAVAIHEDNAGEALGGNAGNIVAADHHAHGAYGLRRALRGYQTGAAGRCHPL